MQVCTSLQTDNHASNPPLSFLLAGCPSCRPTNSVKALKAWIIVIVFSFFEKDIVIILLKSVVVLSSAAEAIVAFRGEARHQSAGVVADHRRETIESAVRPQWQSSSFAHAPCLAVCISQTCWSGQHLDLTMCIHLGRISTYPCSIPYLVSKRDRTNDIQLSGLNN